MLLSRGFVRSVFLERNYSFSAFYNHKVTMAAEKEAARFLRERLHPLADSPSALEPHHTLWVWNRAHPDRMVHIGCRDMEWNVGLVIQEILQPYFRRLDPKFHRDAEHLQRIHRPTRGKVATILLNGAGCSFSDIAGVSLDDFVPSATNHNRFVREFQKTLARGRARADDYYLLESGVSGTFDRILTEIGDRE